MSNKVIGVLLVAAVALPNVAVARDFFDNGNTIWNDGRNVYVRLAPQDESDFGSNEHPVQLDQKTVAEALSQLVLEKSSRSSKDAAPTAVFTDGQARLLGEHLVGGLGRADPEQDIVFALERVHRNRFGLKNNRLYVAGRAFYKDGMLNMIVGEYDRAADAGFEGAYDPTHVGIVAYDFNHGAREQPSRSFNRSIDDAHGVSVATVGQQRRSDWATLNLEQASEAAAINARIRNDEEVKRKRQELRELTERANQAEGRLRDAAAATAARASTATPKPAPAPAPADVATPAGATATVAPLSRSIEVRLNLLNDLKAKGLVTDEEYARKRQQILDAL